MSPAQFERHLAGADLKPVYLLAGEEHLLLLESADALRARARALGYSEREVLESGETGFDWNELGQAAASMSLFSSRRVIDLRVPTGKPGVAGADAIKSYCANPPPDTVLLISCNSWSKAHETTWVQAVERVGATLIFWPLKPRELVDWMAQRASQRGLRISNDGIDLLVQRAEGNLLAGAQEIDKLALLVQGKPLDAAALESLVADSARFDVFALADAALAGDAQRALRIVRALRGEGDAVPGLIGWIVSQLQTLARLSASVEAGASVDAAMRAEHVWAQKVSLFKAALSRGRRGFWEQRIVQAAEVERIGKGRGTGDAWIAFERLIAAIASPGAAQALRST